MAHTPRRGEGTDSLSDFLRARFKELKEELGDPITQVELSRVIGKTDAYVGLLHRGRADTAVLGWQGRVAFDFLKAHRFDTRQIREIAERFKLRNVLDYLDMRDAGTPRPVKEGGTQVRYLGTVSAGRFGDAHVNDEDGTIDIPTNILRNHDPADVFALDVSGDSMMSDETSASIPPGSRVYFHSALRPEPNDVVCVRLEEDDMSVMKVYRPGSQFVTLMSLNGKHRPIVIDESNNGRVEGVMLGFTAVAR